MALNEVLGLLLPVAYVLGSWHDLVWCQVIQALCRPVAPQCQSVAAGRAWPGWFCPGPANLLASLAESHGKLKAYLTDIMWIITISLVLRSLKIRTVRPAVRRFIRTKAGPLQQLKPGGSWTPHFVECCVCRTAGKGMKTVTQEYRPSKRVEDQEAGPSVSSALLISGKLVVIRRTLIMTNYWLILDV